MSEAQKKECPICKTPMPLSERYPLTICNAHYGECHDIQGNVVTYENEDLEGGFVSYHTIGEKIIKRNDGTCFVRGIKCVAGEARMGGIVIQVAQPIMSRSNTK
jgi:hypothetical protein